MEIKWFGHSCFEFVNQAGIRIVCDPYDPLMGKEIGEMNADIVTVSHEHHDHNYVSAVLGNPTIIREVGEHEVCGVKITGYLTMHDDKGGTIRGMNIMYVYELDGMRVLHSGDLGQVPDKAVINQIGYVDVMLVPIGGIYTIDGVKAREFANLLIPKVLIPMHYASSMISFKLEGLEEFLSHAQNCRIHRLNQSTATLYPDSLGHDRILVFKPEA